MNKRTVADSNFELWLLIGKISHSIFLARQKELRQYSIPARQLQVLHVIKDLGANATLSEVAKLAERQSHVISRQAKIMENDGLIKRIRSKPKSNLLKLELTEKGSDIVKLSRHSKSIDTMFSLLSAKEQQELKSILNKIVVD